MERGENSPLLLCRRIESFLFGMRTARSAIDTLSTIFRYHIDPWLSYPYLIIPTTVDQSTPITESVLHILVPNPNLPMISRYCNDGTSTSPSSINQSPYYRPTPLPLRAHPHNATSDFPSLPFRSCRILPRPYASAHQSRALGQCWRGPSA